MKLDFFKLDTCKGYTVVTDTGLELNLDAAELIRYFLYLSTIEQVFISVSVLNDDDFIFRVSYCRACI